MQFQAGAPIIQIDMKCFCKLDPDNEDNKTILKSLKDSIGNVYPIKIAKIENSETEAKTSLIYNVLGLPMIFNSSLELDFNHSVKCLPSKRLRVLEDNDTKKPTEVKERILSDNSDTAFINNYSFGDLVGKPTSSTDSIAVSNLKLDLILILDPTLSESGNSAINKVGSLDDEKPTVINFSRKSELVFQLCVIAYKTIKPKDADSILDVLIVKFDESLGWKKTLDYDVITYLVQDDICIKIKMMYKQTIIPFIDKKLHIRLQFFNIDDSYINFAETVNIDKISNPDFQFEDAKKIGEAIQQATSIVTIIATVNSSILSMLSEVLNTMGVLSLLTLYRIKLPANIVSSLS